jgi:hypothetical protein
MLISKELQIVSTVLISLKIYIWRRIERELQVKMLKLQAFQKLQVYWRDSIFEISGPPEVWGGSAKCPSVDACLR